MSELIHDIVHITKHRINPTPWIRLTYRLDDFLVHKEEFFFITSIRNM